jgi:hypothetical protein
MNRETWLEAAVTRLRPVFETAGHPLPEAVHVACGFPSRSALAQSRRRIGECWYPEHSKDKATTNLLVSPTLDDPVCVLGVLVHECIHAAVGAGIGHKGPFRKLAKRLGLEGKMTATYPGLALAKSLGVLAEQLGDYPHASIDYSKAKKQGTRMLKATCPDCGYVIRGTRQWFDKGLPVCVCGGQFEEKI